MRYVLIAIALAAFSVPALAGGNPTAKVFIDFSGTATDNAGVVSRHDPAQYEPFTVYFGVTDMGMGLETISFMAEIVADPGTFLGVPTFTNLCPGDLAIGTWDTGVTLAATSCQGVDSDREFMDPFYFAKLDLIYFSDSQAPADILYLDHPDYPRWLVDCLEPNGEVDLFCVWTNGGIWKDPEPGDVECTGNTPVEAATWGAIKGLYR